MSYEKWIKLLKHPMDINWSEPLTEEEKAKVCSHLPRIAEFLKQEQKELRLMKKISDQFEREAGAKDTELSKERLRMRLRMKLANKQETKAKEKSARKHSCSKREDCERCQRKRAKKMLAAQKTLDVAKSKNPGVSEELQQNPECEKDLLQYREPDKGNDDDEKEEDGQNNEAEEDNVDEDDGNELEAGAYALPQNYSGLYENHQEHKSKLQEKMDYFANGLFAEDAKDRFNPYFPSHRFDYDRHRFDNGEEVKNDEYDDDEAVRGLKMKFLNMTEKPKQFHCHASEFSKFLNYNYKF